MSTVEVLPEDDVVVVEAADNVQVTIEVGQVGPPGLPGPPGPPSTVPGPPGSPGPPGHSMLYGPADPTPATGYDGDFYINTTTHFLFGPKSVGTWPPGVSIVGPPGTPGNTVLYGPSDPTPADGVNGNFYINTTSHFLFGPKAAGAWPIGTSLVGPQGAQGIQGIQGPIGPQGIPGNTVLYGAGPPSSVTGVDGNFYINTSNNYFYGPKALGVWPPGVSLVGPIGPIGPVGPGGVASAIASPTAPTGVAVGTLWWSSVSGNLFLRYDDGDSISWVQAFNVPAAGFVAKTGDIMSGKLTLSADPTAALEAATKQYVDTHGGGGGGGGTSPPPSDDPPLMDSVAAPGVLLTYSRSDHVHPDDASKYDASNPAGFQTAGDVTAQLGNYLLLSGGVVTGRVTFPPGECIRIEGAAGTNRDIESRTGSSRRWLLQLGNAGAESGGNAGSDFGLSPYADDGVTQLPTMFIERKTGNATFGRDVTVNGGYYGAFMSLTGSLNCYTGGVRWDGGGNSYFNYFNTGNTSSGAIGWLQGTMSLQNSLVGSSLALDGGRSFVFTSSTGYAAKLGGGVWGDSSDERIKTVQGEWTKGLDDVVKLRPVTYIYKGNDTPTADTDTSAVQGHEREATGAAPYPASHHYGAAKEGKVMVGLVAQEVEPVFPGMVHDLPGFIDGVETAIKQLDTSELIFALVNAVKTLAARVEALEAGGG